ncbi:MAG: DUF2842 domain-containing protein [Paracoccaceae bacterium]
MSKELSYKARRRLAILILLVVLPTYIIAAVTLAGWIDRTFGRQPIYIEFTAYILLGIAWILPFKRIFRGVGQAEPGSDEKQP